MNPGSFVEKALFFANAKVGRFVPARLRRKVARSLYAPGGAKPKMLVVDIVGSCNLRCPSCPVGNMGLEVNAVGVMDRACFKKIVTKARREHGAKIVALYNWTEPFLHPELPEFIRIVKDQELVCAISTNLNKLRNIDEVLSAGLDIFRVSLSGFTQESYGTTHVRGDIERVKENMRAVSEAIKRTGASTVVEVYYHKYLDNLHEAEPMRRYVEKLGFEWLESWAYYMPMEKVLALTEGKLTETEADFVENKLALPIAEAVKAARAQPGYNRCSLLEDQIVLDHQGNVNLCCTVYDFKSNRLGSFLDMSEEDLKHSKKRHPTCGTCASKGLHKYFDYFDIPELRREYERLAEAKVEARQERVSSF
jgi:MoaA/NifB/PqqE/SkfB family radical SAM enzyme